MTGHLSRVADGIFVLVVIAAIVMMIRIIITTPEPPPSVLAIFAIALVAAYAIGYGWEVYR